MEAYNIMLADSAAISLAFALFLLVGPTAGYAIGWLTDVLAFRSRGPQFRLAASVPLSVAVLPILGYTLGSLFPPPVAWALFGVPSAAGLALMARDWWSAAPGRWQVWRGLTPFLALLGLWLLIAFCALVDLPFGQRLYYSTTAYDHSVRTAITSAIHTYGLPAQNPFYFPGHPVALRYHYFWMIPCAFIQRLGAPWVDARSAFTAGTMYCGIAMICLVPLYLRLFSANGAVALRRRSLTAICLLGVTGLDLLPATWMLWLERRGSMRGISPSVEWWNDQVDGWVYTMLWEAHYMCSLVGCLLGFLVL